MAVFTLTAVAGAPGVTTTALALTFAWPRDVVLVDADRAASQSVTAGFLAGQTMDGRGLTSVAQSYRDGVDLTTDLARHLQPLSSKPHDIQNSTRLSKQQTPSGASREPGAQFRRWFLPGFSRPGSARLFEPVWPELMASLAELDRAGTDVIVDAGRWGASGPPHPLLSASRAVLVVTRSSLRALAALNAYQSDLGGQVDGDRRLIVVGPGNPYSSQEIGRHFGWPVREMPWQPEDAATLSDGRPARSKASTRPLARAAADAATELRALAQQWDSQLNREAIHD